MRSDAVEGLGLGGAGLVLWAAGLSRRTFVIIIVAVIIIIHIHRLRHPFVALLGIEQHLLKRKTLHIFQSWGACSSHTVTCCPYLIRDGRKRAYRQSEPRKASQKGYVAQPRILQSKLWYDVGHSVGFSLPRSRRNPFNRALEETHRIEG